MALNATEARTMLDASRLHPELVCMLVPSPFTFKVDATAQRLVRDGYLGNIVGVEVRGAAPTFADFESPVQWRQDRDLNGVNALFMGIWYESVLRWAGEATRVMARTRVVVPQRLDPDTHLPRHLTVPDHVEVVADMACGAIGHFQFSAVTGLARPSEIWLFGTEGTLWYNHADRSLHGGRRGDKELRAVEIPPEEVDEWRVEEEFVAAVRGEGTVRMTTFEDGVRYMDFTEAVALSAANGTAVAIPLLGG